MLDVRLSSPAMCVPRSISPPPSAGEAKRARGRVRGLSKGLRNRRAWSWSRGCGQAAADLGKRRRLKQNGKRGGCGVLAKALLTTMAMPLVSVGRLVAILISEHRASNVGVVAVISGHGSENQLGPSPLARVAARQAARVAHISVEPHKATRSNADICDMVMP